MSNEAILGGPRAVALALILSFGAARGVAAASATSDPLPDETIDAFARRQLDAPGDTAADSGLELVFTQTEGRTRSAYLLVDGRYGKDVRRGDVVKGWTVRAIDSDVVVISKNGRRERLLLASALSSHRSAAEAE